MPEITKSRYMVQAGWKDVPHISEQTKRELLAAYKPHERDARTEGIPSMGAGAIYPVHVDDITCDPFPIPGYFRRCYGLDVGWNVTAAVWLAHDLDNDVVYVNSEHYRKEAEPAIHATAIKARGDWVPGAIDPASKGRSQADGRQLWRLYSNLGLNLTAAENSVEAGIYEVWTRLSTGRLKIFSTCQHLLREYRFYRRDEDGKIIKANDHALDALRYGVVTGLNIAKVRPPKGSPTGGSAAGGDRRAGY